VDIQKPILRTFLFCVIRGELLFFLERAGFGHKAFAVVLCLQLELFYVSPLSAYPDIVQCCVTDFLNYITINLSLDPL
jgi:hypothetical protein